MNEDLMLRTISFKLKEDDDLIEIDFFYVDLDLLHQITRVLEWKDYKQVLTIHVNRDIFKEISELLIKNIWLTDSPENDENDEYKILIDGYQLIFKRKSE